MGNMKKAVSSITHLATCLDPASFARYSVGVFLNSRTILRERSLRSADEVMRGRKVRCRIMKKAVTVDGDLIGGVREIYSDKVYFLLPGFDIHPSDVVVDLGANVGMFTLLAALKGRKVVAVEAQAGYLPQIKRYAAANGCAEKVAVEWGLVGGGTGVFADPAELDRVCGGRRDLPPNLSIDQIMERHGLDRIDFLKCDIEGSEYDLLRQDGAMAWLQRTDKIAMEVHPAFGDTQAMKRVLEDHGFDVRMVDRQWDLTDAIVDDTGFVFAKNTRWHSICDV